MNVLQATVTLRDRSLVDTFDLALRFFGAHAKPIATLYAAVILPSFLLAWGIGAFLGWEWAWLFTLFFGLLAQAPFTALTARLLFADAVSPAEALRESLRSLPSLLGARIVQSIAVLVGLCFFLVPALWSGAVLLFLPEILVLERTDQDASRRRAYRMASGQIGEAILATMLLFSAFVAAPLIFDYAGRSLLEDLFEVVPPRPFLDTGGGYLPLLGFWCVVPFCAVARFFVYINLRTRTEGWDIQTRFAALLAGAQGHEVAS